MPVRRLALHENKSWVRFCCASRRKLTCSSIRKQARRATAGNGFSRCKPQPNATPGSAASKASTPGCRRPSQKSSASASSASAGSATTPGHPTAKNLQFDGSTPNELIFQFHFSNFQFRGVLMGRGAQAATRQMTDEERARIDALNQQFLGQQQQVGNLLLPQYQSILNNPGMSAADKAAVTGQSQGALSSAFDSLQQSAQNRLARTRNSAGFGELTDELARQKGIAEAGQAQKNQLAFTNTAFQRQMAALQGLSGLYGIDSNLLARTLGIPADLLNTRANASRSAGGGFFSALGSGLGSTLGALPGALI